MKKIAIYYFCIILFKTGYSQIDIAGVYNSTYSGRNVSLTLSKTCNQTNEIGIGLRYNINRQMHSDNQMCVFKKRLFAIEPIHHLGIIAFYHRKILNQWQTIKPYLVYDLQATYSTTRNRDILPYAMDYNGDPLYKEYIDYFGPFTWVEQNIGIGFKANIYKNIYLTNKMGAGVNLILGYDKQLLGKYFNWFDWEFGALLQTGLVYRIKN